MVKGGGGRGGDASLPGHSRVSCRIRPLAHLILRSFFIWSLACEHERRRKGRDEDEEGLGAARPGGAIL
eukprot:scaffold8421_cov114-Isochrysis_galbana.AAC.16